MATADSQFPVDFPTSLYMPDAFRESIGANFPDSMQYG